jgi:hypothetical protein
MNSTDVTAILVTFAAIGLPVVFGFTLIAHRLRLQQDQFRLMMDERRLLIEKGVTDLPPLELPTQPLRRDRLRHLRAGVMLMAIAAALGADASMHGGRITLFGGDLSASVAILIGLVGLASLSFHFIARAYHCADVPQPSGDGLKPPDQLSGTP